MHACMHVCVFVCVCVCACMNVCLHVCAHRCLWVCLHVCVQECLWVCLHVCVCRSVCECVCMCVRKQLKHTSGTAFHELWKQWTDLDSLRYLGHPKARHILHNGGDQSSLCCHGNRDVHTGNRLGHFTFIDGIDLGTALQQGSKFVPDLLLYPSHLTPQGSPVRCFHSVSLHCLLLYPSHLTPQSSPVRCFHSVSLHCLLLYPSQPKAAQWDVFTQSHSTVYCYIPHSAKQSSEMFSLSLTPLFTAVSLTVQNSPKRLVEVLVQISKASQGMI